MTNQLTPLDDLSLSLPIPNIARQTAEEFARGQPTASKAESIRLNTLAVWVTHTYCQLMDIPTDLASSNSWNPVLRMTSDVADLMLPDLGHLECRPVKPNATTCWVPPEVWDLRIGYTIVEIPEDYATGRLLGFLPAANRDRIPLASLQPIENLMDRLYALRQAAIGALPASSWDGVASLSRWLEGAFQSGWQALENVLAPAAMTPALAFRGAVSPPELAESSPAMLNAARAKVLDLSVRVGQQPVVLVLAQAEGTEASRDITLQVHPTAGTPYLPIELSLSVLAPDNTVFLQAQARQADNYIQLKFSGHPGESFAVRVQLAEVQHLEEFTI